MNQGECLASIPIVQTINIIEVISVQFYGGLLYLNLQLASTRLVQFYKIRLLVVVRTE